MEDKDLVRNLCAWLRESRSSDQGGVYRWLKDESYAPQVTFLFKLDCTATAILQDAWRRINRRYA